jgi:hypothetical protein
MNVSSMGSRVLVAIVLGVTVSAALGCSSEGSGATGCAVKAVVAGEFFTCALTTTGGVRCWGHNENRGVAEVRGTCEA